MPTAPSRSRSARRATRSRSSAQPAARRRSQASAARKPDALKLLKEDHARVKQLFERFERSSGSVKERIARTICEELKVHAQLEEDLFYPAVRDAIDDEELLNEAEVEHGTAKDLIAQIEDSSPSDERFDALVKVLSEYIKHHVKEEEGEMFKKVKRSELDTAALGEQMEEHKRELTARLRSGRDDLRAAP